VGTGTLYLVGTPIGNLQDVSFRAVEVLKEVALVLAEDTRRTQQLLNRYGISTPLTSLNEHNERAKAVMLLRRMKEGESMALVSDAGMPVICDPGASLVAQARAWGIPIAVIPGPSAVTSALAISGFRGDRFLFEGFPPRKPGQLKRWLERLAQCGSGEVVICFESPFRLAKTLKTIQAVLGEVQVAVCREMTKVYEEVVCGSTSEVLGRYTGRPVKGEITLVFQLPIRKESNTQ
jgi:16S rRNA (cytidine1402-2'-O)-methyltransferase